jgi:acyl-CoA ligase (AMP-forming) (exosortase A-associated)
VETVAAIFGTSRAGAVFVPLNPLLKAAQVAYILHDCAASVLVTTASRLAILAPRLHECRQLRQIVLIGEPAEQPDELARDTPPIASFSEFSSVAAIRTHQVIDADMAAVLYTSGSTGSPKGVVLSHRNMVAGARSVASYLGNHAGDRIISLLPFSFDYGFSQLTTAFQVGAAVVLHNYLLPADALRVMARERITGLAAVPPLWMQLVPLQWPSSLAECLRYFTNSGGAMPTAVLAKLRSKVPQALPFLMYGLTEAFRSTYLPPKELDRRPTSIGKAIPNAEILVVREDGTECAADEPGELVHRGALVALGYWNDPQKTAERFKPLPGQRPELVLPEIAVWSGDTVRRDAEGFLYFVSRRDEMIKSSGYRISPTEVEEVVYGTGLVAEAAAFGVEHPTLGQAVVMVAQASPGTSADTTSLLNACRAVLPAFMLPVHVEWVDVALPRNANGKIDRRSLAMERSRLFAVEGSSAGE